MKNYASAALVVATVLCLQALSAQALSDSARAACTCEAGGAAKQLIRGDNQLKSCQRGVYCDCNSGKSANCLNVLGLGFKFDENTQRCSLLFNCEKFFKTEATTTTPQPTTPRQPTTARQTTPTTTTTPKPNANAECVCNSSSSARYQLFRDEVQSCEDGFYCDCNDGLILQCSGSKFNENTQMCQSSFDCKSFLASNTF